MLHIKIVAAWLSNDGISIVAKSPDHPNTIYIRRNDLKEFKVDQNTIVGTTLIIGGFKRNNGWSIVENLFLVKKEIDEPITTDSNADDAPWTLDVVSQGGPDGFLINSKSGENSPSRTGQLKRELDAPKYYNNADIKILTKEFLSFDKTRNSKTKQKDVNPPYTSHETKDTKNVKNTSSQYVDGKFETSEIQYVDGGMELSYASPLFSPTIFTSSYDHKNALKILNSINENDLSRRSEETISIISMLQNIFSRGRNVNKIHDSSSGHSSNIAIMILEASKYDDVVKFNIDYLYRVDYFSAIEEIRGVFEIISDMLANKITFEDLINTSVRFSNLCLIEFENTSMKFELINSKAFYTPPSFIVKTFVEYGTLIPHSEKLNKLLRLCFNYSNDIFELKPQQLEAIDNLMHKKQNTLTVLKTSFGKSLIYQFGSLLQPVPVIAVFPILSLIADQYSSLKRDFRLRYVISNEILKTQRNQFDLDRVVKNKRMFLVTPERIENPRFQMFLKRTSMFPMFLIFDEAHCVSEWGHDFRPSYLIAHNMLDKISLQNNIITLGLTATAAPHIQKDIASLIGVNRDNIINLADGMGLERDEIDYSFIYVRDITFDQWKRSEKYSSVIRNHFIELTKKYNQGILFFNKAGNINNETQKSITSKIAAAEMYLLNKWDKTDNFALYTGSTKEIHNHGDFEFKELEDIKRIYATKSFGMGVNLPNCDYVLLSEPPYSLEDLYQQSGRVGRRGQKSKVDIFYHDDIFIDPLNQKSPYNFFLAVTEDRRKYQAQAFIHILERIVENDFSEIITLSCVDFSEEEWGLVKYAIAHMIVEFDIVKSFSTRYKWMQKQGYGKSGISHYEINIVLNKEIIGNKEDILNALRKTLNELAIDIDLENDLSGMSNEFHDYYFAKLQREKLIGINLLLPKLKVIKRHQMSHSKFLMNVLNEYYRTKSNYSDILTKDIFEYLVSSPEISIEEIRKMVSFRRLVLENVKAEDLMASVSRYAIDQGYINVASIILSLILDTPYLALTLTNDNIEDRMLIDVMTRLLIDEEFDMYDEVMMSARDAGIRVENIEEYNMLNKLRIIKGANNE